MGKILGAILIGVLVVVAGGAWWLYSSLDSVVAQAIRSYGPDITGVSVKLGGVKIQPTEGRAALHGLELGNPAGFKTERALSVGQISTTLDIASLNKDVVLIKEVVVEQPEVVYEYASGGSNLDVIQRHVDNYVAQKLGTSDKSKGKEKKMIIEHLYIRGAKASVSAEMLKGKSMTVPLPDMHLTDIGKKTNGATAGEVAKQVLGALTQSVSKAVGSLNLGGAVDAVKKGTNSAVDTVKGFFK